MGSIDERPSSFQSKFAEFFSKKNIEEQCTEEMLEKMHEAFMTADNERMDETQFYNAFKSTLKLNMESEEILNLFKKINLNRNGFVTWDEFVSYILVEFQEKDVGLLWQTLEPPLAGFPQMMRTHHRSPINKILFCPEVLPDRTSSFLRGCYITASKDGMINYWSLDLDYERSVHSMNPFLRVRPTTITDCIAMPDVQIVCTSSTERDLRFYDTVAKKFDLRVMISSLNYAVICMGYHFSVDIEEESYIILGDTTGSINVMTFSSIEKGPFKHLTDRDLTHIRYGDVVKGGLKGLTVAEFKNVHGNWVSQVAYLEKLRAFVSCSKCSKCSLLVSDPTGTKMKYKFAVSKGISCFTFCEDNQLLITGGPDCLIRIWNPFVTNKPSMILRGHHAAICAIVVQDSGKRLYTVAKDRCIKVWDVGCQACIQTYINLPSELGERTDLSIIYNDVTHKMIIASMMIAVIVCEKVIDKEATDGFTHSQPVSCVLYNSLFKVIVTTGLDSCIIVWDPWLGRRFSLVTKAHSQLLFGQDIGVEITSACFDNSEQLLLTGASDGSVKMWNFHTGTCIKNMAIEDKCEVTSLIWLKNRILCTGWNRHITEFADTKMGLHKKNWETRHTEDVLCATVRYPQALATASYNGEMVLWRLETGQPYRRYQVSDPTRRYTIVYKKEVPNKHVVYGLKTGKQKNDRSYIKNENIGPSLSSIIRNENAGIDETAFGITRTVPVRAMIFLTSRQLAPNIGSLLVSLQSGLIQVWTHHTAAGFLSAFSGIHTRGDYALSLATDSENEFLITGHAAGYIKVWLLKNYVVANPPKVSVPQLRLEFPFLWKDRLNGRAKRAVRDQPLPMLLSSIRGHTKSVTSLQYISGARIIVSGSEDHSVRLWSLGGRYISTLGTYRPWSAILPDTPVDLYFANYRIPPDVKRVASFTTIKVLNGGSIEAATDGKTDEIDSTTDVSENERYLLYGKRLDTPLLGTHYQMPSRTKPYEETPVLDPTLTYIPVFSHLVTHNLERIEAPVMPALLKKQGTTRTLMLAISKLKAASSTSRRKKPREARGKEPTIGEEMP